MERELYNLKTKILRAKHISDHLREELANDVFEMEKLVNKTNGIHYISQQRGLLESFRDWLNNTKTSDNNINNGDLDDFLEDYNCG